MNVQSYVFLSEINQKNSRIPLTLRHKKFFNLLLQQEKVLRINAFRGNRRGHPCGGNHELSRNCEGAMTE